MFFVSNKINYYKNILQCNEFNNSIVNSGNCNTYDSQKLLNVTNYMNLIKNDENIVLSNLRLYYTRKKEAIQKQ